MKIRFIFIVIPALVFFSIWLPEIAHYYVETVPVSLEEIKTLRSVPSNIDMQKLTTLNLGFPVDRSNSQSIYLANLILDGKLSLPGYEAVPIHLPFDSKDLGVGPPMWRLMFASLVAPEILIEAYQNTREERYFDLARKMVLAWAHYERSRWLPMGFLWNDHAIAARSTVLSKFWQIYRAHDDFKTDEARLILQFAYRNGEMLAKSGHFTAATNHGVMQNLALLHIATVFPVLPQARRYLQIAYERLQDQFLFYIDDEGVVLEHSAGYHELGIILIGKVLHYLTLNNITPPQNWVMKHEKGKRFLAQIRRPDGTLPLFGNTLSRSVYTEQLSNSVYGMRETLYPVSGFSIWWRDYKNALSRYPSSQSILAWSHFPGHGHKLADEMSLLIWADGQDWLTNTGYWPYGVSGRQHVDSWEGSNAPHLVGESKNSLRKVELLSYRIENELVFNHLRRMGPDDYIADRQVIHYGEDLWIVVDHTSDPLRRNTTTTWTFASNLNTSSEVLPEQIILSKPAFSCMSASFISSDEGMFSLYKGSLNPFAGWVVTEINQPKVAQSIVIERPADKTWSVAVFALGKDCRKKVVERPKMLHWNNPQSWELALNIQGDSIKFERRDNLISIVNPTNDISSFALSSVNSNEIENSQKRITNTFDRVVENYPRYNSDIFYYRIKISYALTALFFGQILFFFLYGRMKLPYIEHLRALSNVLWVLLGSYLYFIYFKT